MDKGHVLIIPYSKTNVILHDDKREEGKKKNGSI